jgi:hypothetical protein
LELQVAFFGCRNTYNLGRGSKLHDQACEHQLHDQAANIERYRSIARAWGYVHGASALMQRLCMHAFCQEHQARRAIETNVASPRPAGLAPLSAVRGLLIEAAHVPQYLLAMLSLSVGFLSSDGARPLVCHGNAESFWPQAPQFAWEGGVRSRAG